MASIKFTLKKKPNKDGRYSIILVLIKDRKNTSIATAYSCKLEEWSFEANTLKTIKKPLQHEKHATITNFINRTIKKIDDYIEEKRLLEEDFTIQELADEIKKKEVKSKTLDYFTFHQEIINELTNSEKIGTADTNKDTLNSLKNFHNKEQLKFSDLNYEFLQKYESYLRSRGGNDGGIGIKMRTIRAIYNKAIKRNYIPEKTYPFTLYKISTLNKEKKKEYLTEDEIKNLIKKDFSTSKKHQFAKDMFLFSFYCRGMNFIDLINLDHTNLFESKNSYIRIKTGVHLEFKLMDEAQKILDNYRDKSFTKYLFPILLNEKMTIKQIKDRSHKVLGEINPSLKEMMSILKINKHITFYCARHSFATYLKFNNVSIDTIGEMLGHKDIKSTQAYLNKLPSKHLDQILDDLFNKLDNLKK